MVKQTLEHEIKDAIVRYLKKQGFYVLNLASGCVKTARGQFIRFGEKGAADLICCMPDGRFAAIEVKSPKGRLSPEQKQWLANIESRHGLVVVARSVEDVIVALKQNGYLEELF
ncbi:MAG: hypothetical protein Ta2A_10120 [Treponemataceae bacterium]|nr:MAG: hypothetical protein Ta2A_10120 [Treponemataceae bacterium]